MPYVIKPYKYADGQRGYRVYKKDTGQAFSHHPLTREMAERQLRAIYASEGRHSRMSMRGGSQTAKEEEEDKEILEYPLSDSDIRKCLPDLKIISYPDLNDMSHIEEAFDSYGRCLILYLTENEHTGHWVCMVKKGGVIEYFDPYGKYRPDEEGKWLTKTKREELDQDYPTLTNLLKASKYKVVINPYHFQKDKRDISTCGRHCVTRLYHCAMNIRGYKSWLDTECEKYSLDPDELVSAFTFKLIRK